MDTETVERFHYEADPTALQDVEALTAHYMAR